MGSGIRNEARAAAGRLTEAEGDRIAEAVLRLVEGVRAEACGDGGARVRTAARARADRGRYRLGFESWPGPGERSGVSS